jgi:hypothetical protein
VQRKEYHEKHLKITTIYTPSDVCHEKRIMKPVEIVLEREGRRLKRVPKKKPSAPEF